MLRDLMLAVGQLPTAPFLRVLALATTLTLLLLAAAGFGIDAALAQVDTAGWPAWAARAWGWVERLGAIPLVLLASWLLFPAIATGVMALFLDGIVDAVEARHYPLARAPRAIGLGEGARLGLASAARLLGWNLLALPLYIVLLFTGFGAALLFLLINAVLLGRDLWQMVAVRHLDAGEAALRATHRSSVFGLGLLASLLFLLPMVNLLAPLLGAALATHRVHRALGHQPAL